MRRVGEQAERLDAEDGAVVVLDQAAGVEGVGPASDGVEVVHVDARRINGAGDIGVGREGGEGADAVAVGEVAAREAVGEGPAGVKGADLVLGEDAQLERGFG